MADLTKVNINSVDVIATNGTVNTCGFLPSGTCALFEQTAAPLGWTKNTTYDNYALRIVTGTVTNRTSGVNFTDAFVANKVPSGAVSGRTLNNDALASHTHTHCVPDCNCTFRWAGPNLTGYGSNWGRKPANVCSYSCGGGAPHDHDNTLCTNMCISYVDYILASKD